MSASIRDRMNVSKKTSFMQMVFPSVCDCIFFEVMYNNSRKSPLTEKVFEVFMEKEKFLEQLLQNEVLYGGYYNFLERKKNEMGISN